MKKLSALIVAVFVLGLAGVSFAGMSTQTWQGSYASCQQCHKSKFTDMAGAAHYKWEGAYTQINNKAATTVGGKLNSAVNAYCINIMGNWNGCGACHVGLGAKPGTVADATANIDCFICHSDTYKRVRNATTGLFEPDLANMTVTMNQVVQGAQFPTRNACLKCHAKGGGGDALKRGDLALINGTTNDRNYDVHMATTGANLACQRCHTMTNHHVAGRGSDLRPKDSTVAVNCSSTKCHSSKTSVTSSHTTYDTSHHVGRVACQACHIPVYGKKAADAVFNSTTGFGDQATEYDRTWVTPEWSVANNRWEPTVHKANNLKPVYAFFNGTSWVSDLNDLPVLDPATGAYKISRPVGAINTAGSKLTPFKYKTSLQPRHIASGKLIALNTSIYFKTADVAGSIQSGLTNMGLNAADAYDFVKTDEYQMLNHTVSPKAAALACTACHGAAPTHVNLKNMGYVLKAAQSTVCVQCHSLKSNPGWQSIHTKHVQSLKKDCSFCHSFTRASERSLSTRK
jgi:predicted CXXCH cytochrome family protein